MKKIKLRHLASVRFGLNGKSTDGSGVSFITARNITNEGEIDWLSVHKINRNEVGDRDFLSHGEVLFAAKGHRNKAIAWRGENYAATASSTFMIVTLNSTEILPEYLALFLESKKAKAYFAKETGESTIPMIKKGALLDLDIDIPSLKRQDAIIKFGKLINEEVVLMADLIDKKQKLMNLIFE